MDIVYNAYLGTNSSWALVGRHTVAELVKLGHRVKAVSTNGWTGVPSNISILNSVNVDNPVFLGYTVPTRLHTIPYQTKFLIYNYESSILPHGWSAMINRHANLVLPASNYSANIMKKSGVNPDRIKVFPYGVDLNIFRPDKSEVYVPNDKFNFLYCAIPHARKGIDILFESYLETFIGYEDVRLILKTSSRYDKVRKPRFVIDVHDTLNRIKKKMGKNDFPSILIIEDDLDVHKLASLYNSADVYVAPTRAEGFGMTVLEAMACGVQVITTDYSAHSDFINNRNAMVVKAEEKLAPPEMQYWQYQKSAVIGEPSKQQIKDYMFEAYRTGANKSMIAEGLKTADKYTWAKSVKKLEAHLMEYEINMAGHSSRSASAKPSAGGEAAKRASGPQSARRTSTAASRMKSISDISRPSRADIRMQKSGKHASMMGHNVVGVKHAQKTEAPPIKIDRAQKKQIIVKNAGASLKSKSVNRATSGSTGASTPNTDFLQISLFNSGYYENIMSKIFTQIVSAGRKALVYSAERPYFIDEQTEFTRCRNDIFLRYLNKNVSGTIVIDEVSMKDSRVFSAVSNFSIRGKVMCIVTSENMAKKCSKYSNIIILFDDMSKHIDWFASAPNNICLNIDGCNCNIFENEFLPGGMII